MRKVKKLEAKIEKLERDLLWEQNLNRNLEIKQVGDEADRKSLNEKIIQAQNKYIEEVQKNVALADIIMSLRQKLDEAERCGYFGAE